MEYDRVIFIVELNLITFNYKGDVVDKAPW